MPSLKLSRKIQSAPKTDGQVRKIMSDKVMNATWDEDIASRVGYLYDFYHDDEPTALRNLHPEESDKKVPIGIKFIQHTTQTYAKDQITFHVQFRPGQECNVEYYNEFFGERYGCIWPLGLYCDIEDERGQYNRWLIVDKANFYGTQFPTYEVLPCDKIIQYMFKGYKHEIAGALRSQNSYNSGVWLSYRTEKPEDQYKFLLPLNRDTECIFYNQRLILDAPVLTEPRVWRITKINRLAPSGIALFTVAQNQFNEHTDYIELDDKGNVVGMWADFFNDYVPQNPPTTTPPSHLQITYSGVKPEIKINGGYKKLTVPDHEDGIWRFAIGETDASDLVTILNSDDSSDVERDQIKVKFIGGNEYLGEVLTVTYAVQDITIATLRLDIASL